LVLIQQLFIYSPFCITKRKLVFEFFDRRHMGLI
jgi:hypothetical protein